MSINWFLADAAIKKAKADPVKMDGLRNRYAAYLYGKNARDKNQGLKGSIKKAAKVVGRVALTMAPVYTIPAAAMGSKTAQRALQKSMLNPIRKPFHDMLNPDVPIYNEAENKLPAPTAPESSLELSIGTGRKGKSGRNSLKIGRTSSVPKTIGMNFPK